MCRFLSLTNNSTAFSNFVISVMSIFWSSAKQVLLSLITAVWPANPMISFASQLILKLVYMFKGQIFLCPFSLFTWTESTEVAIISSEELLEFNFCSLPEAQYTILGGSSVASEENIKTGSVP